MSCSTISFAAVVSYPERRDLKLHCADARSPSSVCPATVAAAPQIALLRSGSHGLQHLTRLRPAWAQLFDVCLRKLLGDINKMGQATFSVFPSVLTTVIRISMPGSV